MSSEHIAPTPGALCLLWWLEPKAGPAALLGEEAARNHLCYTESPMARAGLGQGPQCERPAWPAARTPQAPETHLEAPGLGSRPVKSRSPSRPRPTGRALLAYDLTLSFLLHRGLPPASTSPKF